MDNGASSYRRFREGDDEGIVQIVRDYKDGLILYLREYVASIHTAEELAEDTFFRLMIKKPNFSGKSSFKSWLYAIGRHIAIDYVRKNARQVQVSPEEQDACLCRKAGSEPAYPEEEADLERTYLKKEQKLQLHEAMKKLSPDYRQILWLSYFEELSNEEIAVVMKKNSRQIRNLLYRAKMSLRSVLEKEGFDYEDFG